MEVLKHTVPQHSSLLEPQTVEKLVEVPVPHTVILADGRDDRGIRWRHVLGRGGGAFWWMVGTNHTRRAARRDSPPAQDNIQILGSLGRPGGRRPCDHAAQVSSSSTWPTSRSWFLRFSSSTECWTLQLCYSYRCRKCGDSAVAVLLGRSRNILRQLGGWLLEEFQFFLHDWIDSAPEVDSRPALLRSGRALRRQLQWHVLYWFCWYLRTSRCVPTHGMEKYAQSMLGPPSSCSLETWTIFL